MGCSALAEMIIPSSIDSINAHAFEGCAKLTDVYYTGDATDWNAMSIDFGNTFFTDATIHYNHVLAE